MSNTTRRRSRTLRLVLAAVALLGIGAAITAAAWEDAVFVDVDIATGSMDLEGQVTTDGAASGWLQSDDENNIALGIDLSQLTPGDNHEVVLELQNNGSMTAYVTFDGTNLVLGDLGACPITLGGDAIPADFQILANDDIAWTLTFETPSDWDDDCQGQSLVSGYVSFQATTDAP